MSNILISIEVKNNTTDNNIHSITTVLAEMDACVKVVTSSQVNSKDIEWCDVYVAIRPNSIYSLYISRAAKESGKFCVISLDDDLLNLPNNHPDNWKRKYTIACLKIGDALLSPNPLILDDYAIRYNLRPILSNSFVRKCDFKAIHVVKDKIKIVYPAGKDHVELFNKYILPFFDKLIRNYGEIVDITFIGVTPHVVQSDSIHFVENMPYHEYLSFMMNNDFDIGIAPLDDNHFCARKYFAKYIEYGKYGICGLYSNVKPYTYAVKNGYNGVLVGNSTTDWEKEIIRILNNPKLITQISINAQNDLKENYSLATIVHGLKTDCPEFENYSASICKVQYYCNPIRIWHFELKSVWRKIAYHIQREGLQVFTNRIIRKYHK